MVLFPASLESPFSGVEEVMDTLLFRVAGLDVHKKFVMACLRLSDPASGAVRRVRWP